MLDFKTNESIQQRYAERKKLFLFHLNKLLLISYFASNNKLLHRKHKRVRFVGFHRRSVCLPSPPLQPSLPSPLLSSSSSSSLLLFLLLSPPPLLSSIFLWFRSTGFVANGTFICWNKKYTLWHSTDEWRWSRSYYCFFSECVSVCLVARLISIHAHTHPVG